MAKAHQQAPESENEEEYEVNAIQRHKWEGGQLHYFVSWVGYPLATDDTWTSEADAGGAEEIIDAYWKSLPPAKQAQRYNPASTSKGKASTKSTPATSVSKSSAKRAADDDTPKSASKAAVAKKAKKNEASPDLSPVKGSERKAAPVKVAPVKKAVKEVVVATAVAKSKAKVVAPSESSEDEDEDEEEEGDMGDNEGYNVEGRTLNHHENEYMDVQDWEPLVKKIDTVERTSDTVLKMFVIWKEDDSYSWVPSSITRVRCPQKVIDFYQDHLKFKTTVDDESTTS